MEPLCSEAPESLASSCHRWPAKATVGRRFRALMYHFVYHRGRNCRLPRSWDRFEPGFATVMGPPDLPVMGPPSARLPGWSRPAVCGLSRSFDLEVAGGVPGGSCARGSRGFASLAG
jgi:hypothetical protein